MNAPVHCDSGEVMDVLTAVRPLRFDGLLLSDDLGMHALSGSLTQRTHGALNAGCDIALHCSGKILETQEVLRAAAEPLGKRVG